MIFSLELLNVILLGKLGFSLTWQSIYCFGALHRYASEFYFDLTLSFFFWKFEAFESALRQGNYERI